MQVRGLFRDVEAELKVSARSVRLRSLFTGQLKGASYAMSLRAFKHSRIETRGIYRDTYLE